MCTWDAAASTRVCCGYIAFASSTVAVGKASLEKGYGVYAMVVRLLCTLIAVWRKEKEKERRRENMCFSLEPVTFCSPLDERAWGPFFVFFSSIPLCMAIIFFLAKSLEIVYIIPSLLWALHLCSENINLHNIKITSCNSSVIREFHIFLLRNTC